MAAEKFLIEIKGEGFVLTQQGSGDLEAAKAAVSAAYPGTEVTGSYFGEVDMSGK